MRTTRCLLTLILVLGTVLACVPGAAPTPQVIEKQVTTEVEKQVVVTATPAPQETVEVTWYVRSEPKEQLWENDVVIPEFERLHPNIKIKLVITPWADFDTKMMTMIAAGDPPDIWSHWGPSGFQDYVKRGLVADLTPYIERDSFDTADFFPEVLDIYTVDGKVYGLPVLTGGSFLFYNKDLFDKYKVEYPPTDWDDKSWTYDEFLARAKALTHDVDDPSKAVYGANLDFWPNDAYCWLFGGDVYPPEAYSSGFASEAFLDSEPCLRGFQARQDAVYTHKVMPSPSAVEAFGEQRDVFTAQRVAMHMTGVWGWWQFAGLEAEFRWGVAALPWGGEGRRCVVFTDPWMMSAQSKHPEETWEFLKYLVSFDVQNTWMKTTGCPPVRRSLLPEFYKVFPTMTPQEVEQVFLGSLKHGGESPNHLLVRFDQLNNVVSAALDPINLGEAKPADVLPVANQELEKTLQTIESEHKQ